MIQAHHIIFAFTPIYIVSEFNIFGITCQCACFKINDILYKSKEIGERYNRIDLQEKHYRFVQKKKKYKKIFIFILILQNISPHAHNHIQFLCKAWRGFWWNIFFPIVPMSESCFIPTSTCVASYLYKTIHTESCRLYWNYNAPNEMVQRISPAPRLVSLWKKFDGRDREVGLRLSNWGFYFSFGRDVWRENWENRAEMTQRTWDFRKIQLFFWLFAQNLQSKHKNRMLLINFQRKTRSFCEYIWEPYHYRSI